MSEDGQYGPNTKAVVALIDRVKTLSPLVVEDLISREHFKALYAPWASVMEENKMSTTALKSTREITIGEFSTDARIRVSVTADGAVLSIGSMLSSLQNSTVMTRDELIELRDAINTVLNETSGV